MYEIGDKVVCVDDIRGELTYNKEYIIVDVWGKFQPDLKVENDKGEKRWYYHSHFRRTEK